MTTFTREYSNAKVAINQDGLENVVLSIYCIVTATDGDYSVNSGITINLPPPDSSQFVPFDQITQGLVDSWVTTREEYLQLERLLSSTIEEKKNPTTDVKPLPFSA